MPSGVEHNVLGDSELTYLQLIAASMPSGVEHSAVNNPELQDAVI